MIWKSTLLAGVAAGMLLAAGCHPRHQAVRRESFAPIEAERRGEVFDRALQVLLGRGWVMATVDREAGVLATQPRETYVPAWALYEQDAVQVSFRADGRLAVAVHRQLRPVATAATTVVHHGATGGHVTTGGDLPIGPDPARIAAEAESEQQAILFEITSATPVAALDRCRELAGRYKGALAQAKACGELGARVCGGLRPLWDEGAQVPGTGMTRVVPSRTAELDVVLAEYRDAACAFSGRGASVEAGGEECLGAVRSPACQ